MEAHELIEQFQLYELPKHKWTHEAHLTVGLFYVVNYKDEALSRIRQDIKNLNEYHGVQNTDSSGYHETITVFWINAINVYLSRNKINSFSKEILEEFLNSPFASKDLPLKFYTKELLFSTKARRELVKHQIE